MSVSSAPLSKSATQSSKFDGIDLADNTRSADDEQLSDVENPELEPEESPAQLTKTSTWVPNAGRLRQEMARRKYAKYSEDRYNETSETEADPQSSTSKDASSDITTGRKTDSDPASHKKVTQGRIHRGQQKVKGLLKYRKKTKSVRDRDVEIDILYENQRGSWLFGTPLYSSKSLLNFDPPAWTTSSNSPSSVNTTNAQLPDPSWEWVWKTWYVDMSLDVDELGWQYSFMFQNRYPWHGTHPWFYSFVRRRRWIRKRVRRQLDGVLHGEESVGTRRLAPTHKLNADYFSVHAAGQVKESESSFDHGTTDLYGINQSQGQDDEVDDMPTLLVRLKSAMVDREKINLVREYMDHGGEDTHYLADEMPRIMSYLMFQHSRRTLLITMLDKLEEREKDHGSKDQNGETKGKEVERRSSGFETQHSQEFEPETDDDRQRRKTVNLTRAVEAADRQIKQLEYWSDLREVTEKGEGLGAAEKHFDAGGPLEGSIHE